MKTSTTSAAAVLGVALVATLGAQPASAKHRDADRVRASGTCSQGSAWTLTAKADDAQIETELEIDGRVGQAWSVRLADDGVRVWPGTRRTVGPSGSFSVEPRSANRAGTDRLTATAHTGSTGETCTAAVLFAR